MMMRVGNRLLGAALISSLLGGLPGCSFLFTTAPKGPASVPEQAQYAPQECTTSKAAPIVDTAIATFQAVRTGLALAADDSVYENAPISRGTDVAFGLGFLALFGASAIYGFYVTGECSKLHHHGASIAPPQRHEEEERGDPNDVRPPAPRHAQPSSELAP